MKILFSSYHNPRFLTVTEYIENAIRSNGHQLFCFDDRNYLFPGRLRNRFEWLNRFEHQRLNKQFIRLALKIRPDIAIIAGGHRIGVNTIKLLKKRRILCVLWTIDAPIAFQPILDVAPFFNYIFCQGTEAVEILENAGNKNVHWLPVGCDPEYHKRIKFSGIEREKYGKEIAFVGSYYPNRWKILSELKDFDIGIWGPRWNQINDSNISSIDIKDIHLNYSSWVKIYSAAKIVIVIHYQDGKIPCYQISPKVFEAMACNSFVLVDRQKDVFSIFEDKTHLVEFDSADDLKKKIRYYLNNPEERQKIANAGSSEVLEKHLYFHRVNKIFSTINN
jgi:spore maturation protein CgeB